MAHHVEPMDIDSDFDNKENSLHHNNVLPFTEKGYEELDVSELNMKLRYSITPASSPMSKSYTANCLDNKSLESGEDSLNVTVNENSNLTRSLNSTMTKNDNIVKSLKALPLQALSTEQYVDNNRSTSVLRTLDTINTQDTANVTVAVARPSDIDDNLSLPSSLSSTVQTPEAITPTKDIPKSDGSSPIMRGLKSVLNMFRSSQSPIPPADSDDIVKPDISGLADTSVITEDAKTQAMLASTPISAHRRKETSPTKKSSPKQESIVFNEDLETELQWKDETTILFSQERIPIHKLFFQPTQSIENKIKNKETDIPISVQDDMNSTVEYMDISYNDSIRDRTMTDIQVIGNKSGYPESDSEFVDCETTFTKDESIIDDKDKTPVIDQAQDLDLTKENTGNKNENTSASRLKQIILNTTQDILDATLSITPDDLIPEAHIKAQDFLGTPELPANTEPNVSSECGLDTYQSTIPVSSSPENIPALNETTDIDKSLFGIQAEEDPNATKTINNEMQPVLNKTIDIETTTYKDDKQNVNNSIGSLANEIIKSENQPIYVSNLDTTSVCETIEHHEECQSTYNVSHLPTNPLFNILSGLNATKLIESNADNVEAKHSSPGIIEEAIPIPADVDPVFTNDASRTELAADVPLPDEDDLEKEQITPAPEVSAAAMESLTLDLVDDIKTESETSKQNLKEKVKFEAEEAKFIESKNNDVFVTTPELQAFDTQNIEPNDNIHNASVLLDPKMKKMVTEKIVNNNLKHEKKYDEVDNKNKSDQVPDYIDVLMNRTETVTKCVDATLLCKNELNVDHTQGIVPMDIKERVADVKPLPDIINQTITVPFAENVEGNEVPTKVPAPVDQPEYLENNIINSETSVATDTVLDAHSINNDMIPTETSICDSKKQPNISDIPVSKNGDVKPTDEEIVLSENNSPFVSVIAEDIPEMKPEEKVEVQRNDNESTSDVAYNSPASPPITSKGYNFNFDEIDDPFATKTRMRLSPSTPSTPVEPQLCSRNSAKSKEINGRKSQTERKKPVAPKRKFNSTFSGAVSEKVADKPVEKFAAGDVSLELPTNVALDSSNATIDEDKLIQESKIDQENTLQVTKEISHPDPVVELEDKVEQPVGNPSPEASKCSTICENLSDKTSLKEITTSSSDQSTYYSAGTSSNESFHARNVFNIPEIDDMNFNPFATKSKMRQSPPLSLDTENPFTTKSKMANSPESSIIVPQNEDKVKAQDTTKPVLSDDKIETELMEKDASGNLSNTTTSSKTTDERNATMREVHTEDEDTIEGPFLEVEDFNTDHKMTDFDGEHIDMMHFDDLPPQESEDNLDNGEMFIDAEAFEFLLNQNKCNTVVDSGKESLFLKFDPLFAKRMSSVTSDKKIQKRQSTPTKTAKSPLKEAMSPIAGPSNLNITQDMDMNMSEEFNDDLNITVSKPTMAVPPAINSVTPRNKSLTPNRSNRRSITFTSPAMAVIDRLLSLSGNSSLVHDTMSQATREQNEADLALVQLRELLAEKEIHVYNLRSESKELRDRLNSMESHLKSLEEESQDRLKKINSLNERLIEKTKINNSMAAVVEEYERTIARLISETAQDKKRHAEEKLKLINERDEQTAHLASMEVSFSDLHSKYEKSKQVILNCKANEDAYKKSIKEFQENLTKMQTNYELLKQHATSKLNYANQELEKMNRTHEAEVLKLNAMIKRKELHITSLEESLAQKTKANEELTAICDELINKVG